MNGSGSTGRTRRAYSNLAGCYARKRLLKLRPARPSYRRGPVQTRARYALWALGEASTSEIMVWTHCMREHRGERRTNGDRWSARRALLQIGAVSVGRAHTIGRPIIWKLPEDQELT
jgi:hypothetical protein